MAIGIARTLIHFMLPWMDQIKWGELYVIHVHTSNQALIICLLYFLCLWCHLSLGMMILIAMESSIEVGCATYVM